MNNVFQMLSFVLCVQVTPVVTNSHISTLAGKDVFFKCELFQKTGSFKARGACNAVFSLSAEDAKRGVVTHSSGNHGQALAFAAQARGIPAYIVAVSRERMTGLLG